MQIQAQSGDSHEFIEIVTRVANDVIRDDAPENMMLIHIDNWFGRKWLGFAGKTLGALGVWHDTLVIPPFVPKRVLSQRKYVHPLYQEVDAGEPIHREMPSQSALTRKASTVAPGASLLWYSGNSARNRRGSVMVFIPQDEGYRSWYAGWIERETWELAETAGIKPKELVWEAPLISSPAGG